MNTPAATTTTNIDSSIVDKNGRLRKTFIALSL
jgi:hypothetical protein